MRARQEGFAEVNGARLHYEVAGSGSPLVFVHGFTLDLRMWDDQVDFFSRDHTCLRFDLRGFGKSSLPDMDYSHHEDLHALMKYLGIDGRVALVGLSMGGLVATDYALAWPRQIRGLVLVDAIVGGYEFKDFAELDEIYQSSDASSVSLTA